MKKAISVILAVLVLSGLTLFGCNEPKKDVSVKYYNSGADLRGALEAGTETIGLLPEPAATALEKRTQGRTWYRLDLQELYDDETKAYPQAVLMVKSSLLSAYPDLAENITSKIAENVSWVKSNTATAVATIGTNYPNTTLKAPMLTSTCIDNCKIYSQSATEAKQSVNDYISDIRSIYQGSANTVGDDFFYSGEQSQGTWTKSHITFYAPDGAPALAIAKFIADNESFDTDKPVNYSIISSDSIIYPIEGGFADIILMPINFATQYYNAGSNQNDPYKLVSVITHGNLYIMSKEELTVADFKDKRIGVPNMGAVPDLTFQSVLKKNSLTFQPVN